MKRSVVAAIMTFVLIAAMFAGCSRLPDEPPVESIEKETYINPVGATVTAQDINNKDELIVKYVKTVDDIELDMKSYYVFGKNAAEMTFKEFSYDGVQVTVSGFVDVKMIAIGKRSDDMKIGYTAFDADGKEIYRSYVLIRLKGVKKGETVENRRFHFPTEAVKVVFYDYTGNA
ncbi:MAG: hypothetical protein MJ173_07925 [Clostridia bacterium]|nr:hypothetical protein [Clostridia bacterium]